MRVLKVVTTGVAVVLLMNLVFLGRARGTGILPVNRNPEKLRILNDEYPRVFFFRQAEGVAAQKSVSYEQWEKTFERLMGIEGKVLD